MHVEIKDLQEGKPYSVKCYLANEKERAPGMWWWGHPFVGWFHFDPNDVEQYHRQVCSFRSDDGASIFVVAVEDIDDIDLLESAPSITGVLPTD
ncbi:MAG: hypothetical protein RLZZ26_552 [Candidatus Parcubacteria bacterium]|jgi:hypothetical protein